MDKLAGKAKSIVDKESSKKISGADAIAAYNAAAEAQVPKQKKAKKIKSVGEASFAAAGESGKIKGASKKAGHGGKKADESGLAAGEGA